jgi:serine/threonine protein kinase
MDTLAMSSAWTLRTNLKDVLGWTRTQNPDAQGPPYEACQFAPLLHAFEEICTNIRDAIEQFDHPQLRPGPFPEPRPPLGVLRPRPIPPPSPDCVACSICGRWVHEADLEAHAELCLNATGFTQQLEIVNATLRLSIGDARASPADLAAPEPPAGPILLTRESGFPTRILFLEISPVLTDITAACAAPDAGAALSAVVDRIDRLYEKLTGIRRRQCPRLPAIFGDILGRLRTAVITRGGIVSSLGTPPGVGSQLAVWEPVYLLRGKHADRILVMRRAGADDPPRSFAVRQVPRLSPRVPVVDWMRAVLDTFSGDASVPLARYAFSMRCRANLYLATDICDFSLADLLEARPTLSTPFCQLLTRQIGLALQALHDIGIALANLAPSNILFSGDEHTVTFCNPGYAWVPRLREGVIPVDVHGPASRTFGPDGHRMPLFCAPHGPPSRNAYSAPELLSGRPAWYGCWCPYALDVWAYGEVVSALVRRTPEGQSDVANQLLSAALTRDSYKRPSIRALLEKEFARPDPAVTWESGPPFQTLPELVNQLTPEEMGTVDFGVTDDQQADPTDGDMLWFDGMDDNLKGLVAPSSDASRPQATLDRRFPPDMD